MSTTKTVKHMGLLSIQNLKTDHGRRKNMNASEINRYLELVDRRLFILVHSGVDWQTEYAAELEAIDKELAELRKLVDQEHERRRMTNGVC